MFPTCNAAAAFAFLIDAVISCLNVSTLLACPVAPETAFYISTEKTVCGN
jgi:hypothetical protein